MNKKTLLVSILSLGALAGCTINLGGNSASGAASAESSIIGGESGENSVGESGEVPPSTASGAVTQSSSAPAASTPAANGFTITTNLTETKEIHTAAQKTYLEYTGDYASYPVSSLPSGREWNSDPLPVKLAWEYAVPSGKTLKRFAVTFGQKDDLSDGFRVEGSSSKSLNLQNVFLGKNYFKVIAEHSDNSEADSGIMSFNVTTQAPRNIKIDGMTNCRDMGGRTTVGGGKVKQGMIYRTSGVKGGNPANVTAEGLAEMKNHFKMKTEINVSDGTSYNGTGNGWDVINHMMDYDSANQTHHHFSRNAESLKAFFKTLSDSSKYPVFFHCRIGTDRTGLCANLLGGLLGVDKNELYQDYLFSNFGNIGEQRKIGASAGQDNIENYMNEIDAMPGATFANKCYNTLLAIGVERSTLDTVISLLTEGNVVPGNNNGQLIGKGTGLTGTGVTMSTSSTNAHPEQYYVLNSSSKVVTYNFTTTETMNAVITAYLGSGTGGSTTLSSALDVKVDGTSLTLPSKSFKDAGFGTLKGRTCYYVNQMGEVSNLAAGAHTLTIQTTGSSSINVGALGVFNKGTSSSGGQSTGGDPVTPPAHTHTIVASDTKNATNDLYALSCSSCNEAIAGGELKFDKTKTPDSGSWDGDKLKGNLSFNVSGIAAGTYDLYMKAGYSTNNGGSNFTSNSISSGYSSRYTFKVDDGADVAITNTKSYQNLGFGEGVAGAAMSTEALCSITIGESASSFKVLYTATGYSVYMLGIRLVKTA
ncbi:MAG: tyrosine-protein phosphatase [Bacilli bacterium]|nr:tyrosine-protein phosphatase [Bacilli bacterium]